MTDTELLLHQLKNPPVMSMALNKDPLYQMMAEHMQKAADRIEALVKEKDQEYKNNIVRMAGQARDFMEEISTLKTRIEALSISNATLIAERDHWKNVAEREGVCMTCRGPRGAPEPYGCSDCLNTGYCGEHHNTVADLEAKLATCEKYRDAYSEMGRIGTQAVRDLEAKLAENEVRLGKAVEALEEISEYDTGATAGLAYTAKHHLAEIKSGVATTPYGLEGESHE